MGAGIGIYFAMSTEPSAAVWTIVVAVGLASALAAWFVRQAFAPLVLGLTLMVVGGALAGVRTWTVAAPVLSFRYYGPIEGRIVEIDRSASDALRLTLDHVVLEAVTPERTPERVRVSLRGDQRWLVAEPGRRVMLTGHLAPPSGPAEPGDFDFRRMAWFEKLGAVGYTQTPVLTRAPPDGGLWLPRLRTVLSEGLRSRIDGDAGGLAAAVATGDRSGLSAEANQAMRDSGLYHLVSISGTHMGLLVAFVFGLVRTGIAAVPPVALRLNGKKVAAFVALPSAAFYLALAGRDVATERAFIMVVVILGAVLADRQAITLRSVGIAALIVLALRPESLTNPGFQMSFAAVAALSATVGQFPDAWRSGARRRWIAPAALLLGSSLVAGLATGPYAGAHFNRFAAYGLLANLLAAPAMGLLIMPGAVLAAIGSAVGLMQPALLMLELGCRWTLLVADVVAGLDGAAGGVATPPPFVLPMFTLGGLFLLLWQGHARWLGLAVLVMALAFWPAGTRPDLLIAESGGVMAVSGDEGRAVSRPKGEGFSVKAWLENDGDIVSQEDAAQRPGILREERTASARLGETEVLLVRGKIALSALVGCDGADILVTDQVWDGARPCLVLDTATLARSGSVAGWVEGAGLRLVATEALAGVRPWTCPSRSREDCQSPALGP
ncbi:ComEC family competence protein [Rubellimicrobium rubrum]|uniref:ComEC family competence protein n=1 Tax=Rubellimicrobium rubrum TaxID=2585369 RepID=A0A5C4N1K0_9RHOB|nr:ComEC/Rec2 family competence protein [Rubellimicrobium rubrum]TNC50817.1 ComEC family competence protein [Rubellimicrobium rubrum]